MMQDAVQKNIQDLYNYHFYKHSYKEQQPFGSIIRMKGLEGECDYLQELLGRHFKMIKRKYSVGMEYYTKDDFVQEYSILFVQACYKLEVIEPLSYLFQNLDIYFARLSFIKSEIQRQFHAIANPTTYTIPTKQGRKYIDVDMSSLDVVVNNEDSQTALINLLEEDSSMYVVKQAHYNHFIEWVLDNHSRILTAKQDSIFIKLMDIYQPLIDRSANTLEKRNEMLEEINSTNSKLKHMFRNIKNRCIRKYDEEHNGIWKSRIAFTSQHLHNILIDYTETADYKFWNNQEERQRALTKQVTKNYDTEDFEVIIIKGLKTEEIIDIVRGVKGKQLISNKVLRKIKQNVDAFLATHDPINDEASFPEYEYKENMFEDINKAPASHFTLSTHGTLEYTDDEGRQKQYKNE